MALPRIGLFGGTFDPPHLGHVAALEAASASGRFDVIVVTVAGDPYRKSAARLVRPAAERRALAHLAFDGIALVEVSDREIRRGGPSYTIDTVRELRDGVASIDLLVGADAAASLPTWHGAAELATLVTVGIFPRPGSAVVYPEGFTCYELSMGPVDLSSTVVRTQLDDQAALEQSVPTEIIPLLAPSTE